MIFSRVAFRSALLSGFVFAASLAHAEDDPIPEHILALDQATKGLRGAGPLLAKIEVEQAGKPLGTFTCELYDKKSPKTVANFVGLARGIRPFKDAKSGQWVKRPFFDGLTFYRVIPDFLIQGGDPLGTGAGTPGYPIPDEYSEDLRMDRGGLLAMANAGPGTGGSQFFITEKAAPHLTGRHTIFGSCQPLELVQKIARTERGPHDAPAQPVVMKRVTVMRAGKTTK